MNNCEHKRKIFLDDLNVFRQDSSDTNRQTRVYPRSGFKNLARKCRREYDPNQTGKLGKSKLNNVNDYWKLLKGTRKRHKKTFNIRYGILRLFRKNIENINIVADDFIMYHCMKLLN